MIGLGQIGTSIGLSLAKYSDRITRTGYDRVLDIQNKAKGLGAVDSAKFNLLSSVEGADVVLLCIPLDQVEETLRLIGQDLREDAVVMNFSPQKSAAYEWFKKHVPAGRHYIGLVPAVNPMFIEQIEAGISAARVDLFEGATIGISAPSGTSSEAIKLATDLIQLLGGQALFLDMLEADGMELTAHILPQVISVAMLNATVGQPGWTEARRFAGRPFILTSAALGTDPLESIAQALLANSLGAASVLENAIGALSHIRTAILNGDQYDLQKRLELAFFDREKWMHERMSAEWEGPAQKSEVPKSGDLLKRIFFGDRKKDSKK